jgi:hypothetical protein
MTKIKNDFITIKSYLCLIFINKTYKLDLLNNLNY